MTKYNKFNPIEWIKSKSKYDSKIREIYKTFEVNPYQALYDAKRLGNKKLIQRVQQML